MTAKTGIGRGAKKKLVSFPNHYNTRNRQEKNHDKFDLFFLILKINISGKLDKNKELYNESSVFSLLILLYTWLGNWKQKGRQERTLAWQLLHITDSYFGMQAKDLSGGERERERAEKFLCLLMFCLLSTQRAYLFMHTAHSFSFP